MKISTKFRLKYLLLLSSLLLVGGLSLFVFNNPGIYLAIGLAILLFGQLIILGTSSTIQCPSCKKYVFNMEGEANKNTIGYQSVILSLLAGKCSSCEAKL